jgi:hypothetical protein
MEVKNIIVEKRKIRCLHYLRQFIFICNDPQSAYFELLFFTQAMHIMIINSSRLINNVRSRSRYLVWILVVGSLLLVHVEPKSHNENNDNGGSAELVQLGETKVIRNTN